MGTCGTCGYFVVEPLYSGTTLGRAFCLVNIPKTEESNPEFPIKEYQTSWIHAKKGPPHECASYEPTIGNFTCRDCIHFGKEEKSISKNIVNYQYVCRLVIPHIRCEQTTSRCAHFKQRKEE